VKIGRIIILVSFLIFLMVAAWANAAPGGKFWAMDVGNYWVLDGSGSDGSTWTWRNEVVALDTTTVPGVTTHYVEGRDNGTFLSEKTWYSVSQTEMRRWRVEFYDDFSGWHTVIINGGFRELVNPIVSSWTDTGSGTWDGTPFNATVQSTLMSYANVIVPLGTYKAYQIQRVITLDIAGVVENRTFWFVPYIGVVKDVYDEEITDTEVLASMRIKKDIDDFDRDGQSDLAGITSANQIYYTADLQNWVNIPGVLAQRVAGDFNGDGYADLAGLTSAGQIYYTTDLQNWTNIPGVLAELLPVGDFDGDGQSDLAGITSGGQIYYTTDLQNWVNIPGVLAQWVVGDFNGDGHSDLAGLTSGGQIYYTTDLQNWTYIPGVLAQLVVGDFNGDGYSDLAGLTSGGQIYYTTDLQNWTHIPGVLAELLPVGDFNGDGLSDLAGITSGGQTYYTTDLQNWTHIPGTLDQWVVGDFNGDGHSDFAGLTSAGQIYYTTDLQNWTYIPGVLSELVE